MRDMIGAAALVIGGLGLLACAASQAAPGVRERACLAAVAETTNNLDVAVLGRAAADAPVMIGVGPDRAPWQCRVSGAGVVAGVMSMTDEGAL